MSRIVYYLNNGPEHAVKLRIIIYYTYDGPAAKRLALLERGAKNIAMTRDASVFYDVDAEPCDRVYILPDVPNHYRETIVRAYGDKIAKTPPLDESYEPRETPAEETPQLQRPPTTRNQNSGETPLDLMTKRELREHALARGVHIDPDLVKRDDILKAVRASVPT